MAGNHESESESQTALSAQVFQILLSLLDEDLHGYALIQDIRRRTDGEVVLTASTLYAATKRLVSVRLDPGGGACIAAARPRRATSLLSHHGRGRAAARAEALRLERLTAMARDKRLLGAFGTAPQPKGSR